MTPGQVHSWHFEKGVDGYLVHFNEVLFTAFLQESQYLQQFSFFKGDADAGVCEVVPHLLPKIISLFEELIAEKVAMIGLTIDLIRLRLLEVFILIERFCPAKHLLNKPPLKIILLRNFQKLVDQHFRTLKLPKEYAGLLHVAPNHLNALCQEVIGKTAGDLIRDRILLEAKRLLTNADMTIGEIAYDLNFGDSSYFSRFFKKYEGQRLITSEKIYQADNSITMRADRAAKIPSGLHSLFNNLLSPVPHGKSL
jgi:AraC-like DNA-binding protein